MHSFPLYSSIPRSSFLSTSHSLPPTLPHLSIAPSTGLASTTYLASSTGTRPHATSGSVPIFQPASAIIDVVQDQPFHFSFAEHLSNPGDSARSFSADPSTAEGWVRLFKAGKLVYGFVPADYPPGRAVVSISVSSSNSTLYNLSFELIIVAAAHKGVSIKTPKGVVSTITPTEAIIPTHGITSSHAGRNPSAATNSTPWYPSNGYSSSLPRSFAPSPTPSSPIGPRTSNNSLRTSMSLVGSPGPPRPSASPRKPSSSSQASQTSRQGEPATFLPPLAATRSSVAAFERPSDPALYASSTRNIFTSPTRRPPLTLPSWRPFNSSSTVLTSSPPSASKSYKIKPTLRRPSVSTLRTVSSTTSAVPRNSLMGEPLLAPSENRPSISSENAFWSSDYRSQKVSNSSYIVGGTHSLASSNRVSSLVGASPTKSSSRERLSSTLPYARSSPTRNSPSRIASTGVSSLQAGPSIRTLSSSLPGPGASFMKAGMHADIVTNSIPLSAQASPIVSAWAPSPTKQYSSVLYQGGGTTFPGVHSRSSSTTSTTTVNRKASFTTPLSQTIGIGHGNPSPRPVLATPPRSNSSTPANASISGQSSNKYAPLYTKPSEYTSWRTSSVTPAAITNSTAVNAAQPFVASFAISQGASLNIDLKADLQHIGDYPHTFTTDPVVKWINWASPNHSTLKATAPSTFTGNVCIEVKVLTSHNEKPRRAGRAPVGIVSYSITFQLSVLPRKQSTLIRATEQAVHIAGTNNNTATSSEKKSATTIIPRPSILSRITTSSSSTTATNSSEPVLTSVRAVARGDTINIDLKSLLRHPDDSPVSLRTSPEIDWLGLVMDNHAVVGHVPLDCPLGIIGVIVEAQKTPKGVRKLLARPAVCYTISLELIVASQLGR